MINCYQSDLPVSSEGLIDNHFVSGRIAAGVAPHGGITYISYIGKQRRQNGIIFSASPESAFTKLGRVQILIDGRPYYSEFNNTRYYPFGYRSECEFENVRFRHELILDKNVLFQRIQVMDNPGRHEIRARLLQHGFWAQATNRQVSGWTVQQDGSLSGNVREGDADIAVRLSSSLPCKTSSRNNGFKFYLETTKPADEIIFAFSFDTQVEDYTARVNRVFESYHIGVRFETGSIPMNSALNNILPTLDALAVTDSPGAVRASQHYWIWGWDSMVHAEAYLWSGNTAIVRDMLDFYRETADPEHGIGHSLTSDFVPDEIMKTCAQGLYIVLLYNYYAVTGDRETLNRNLEFARTLLKRAGANRHPHSSLGKGIGYFPDFPQMLDQRENDISLINNSLYLQALRCMAELSQELAHTEEADKLQADMERILWDDETGYWCDSADGETLARRPYHPLYGQLYVSPFGSLPQQANSRRIAAYLKNNFQFKHGLYMYPANDPGFMADGNQLGAYYPPMDRYYWNMMNQASDATAAEDFERIVEYFWQYHCYPEGLTHETMNDDPTIDNPGGKQAFSMKGWFCDALELHLGLRVYLDGFTCRPLNCGTYFRAENLILRGKQLTLERLSSGKVLLNNQELPSGKITWDML